MVFATIDPGVAGSTLSAVVRKQFVLGRVVMGAASSKVERAKVGDTFMLLGSNGRQVEVRVGAVVADRVVGRAELIIPQSVATSLALVVVEVGRLHTHRWYGATLAMKEEAGEIPARSRHCCRVRSFFGTESHERVRPSSPLDPIRTETPDLRRNYAPPVGMIRRSPVAAQRPR